MLDEVGRAVVGKQEALRLVLCAVLAKGHVLLEDFPGLGKTLAARSFARALGLDFARAQFTPDLLPRTSPARSSTTSAPSEFEFRRGPLFTGLLLADEINRTPPKTQSALLEAMQERQVTVEGETFPLADPFHVLATANPIEYEGTYPLPEAQLDRFLLRVSFGYPSSNEEYDVIVRRVDRRQEEVELTAVTGPDGLRALQATVETVRVDESVGRYCVALAAATREHRDTLTGASPRGSLGLVLTARAFAVLRGSRLRDPRGRQGGRALGAGAPGHGPARALDDPDQRPLDRGRGDDAGPDARRRSSAGDPAAGCPTPALARAVVVAAVAVVAAVIGASPAAMVLGAPFVLLAGLGLLHRPDSRPAVTAAARPALADRGPGHHLAAGRSPTARTSSTWPGRWPPRRTSRCTRRTGWPRGSPTSRRRSRSGRAGGAGGCWARSRSR